MSRPIETGRHIGLFGATCIGVGAIVGGGILALAGVAFERAGAGAILAFALNGAIAAITALSFAELSTAFPQSGGPYVFAKRVLSIGTAFGVGWIVWFASIVAAVLYALGFAAFAVGGVVELGAAFGGYSDGPPAWLTHRVTLVAVAAVATIAVSLVVSTSAKGGGNAVSIAKVLLFAILVVAGFYVWSQRAPEQRGDFAPLFPNGGLGLVQAMGFTFIALQGFDLIAAVAGEVDQPRRTLPRAMFIALGIGLGVYIPLLVVLVVIGPAPGQTLGELVAANPETVVAEAARNFLGPTGYWIVLVAGLLSMLSALLANVYAGSRIAQAMARDRTLPEVLERAHEHLGTPVMATVTTGVIALAILLFVGDVAAAGAASSLIFLVTFALAHVLCLVVRKRKPGHAGFRVPFFPWLPIAGAVLCGALAIFQGVVVPAAGMVCAIWLGIGVASYVRVFQRRARVQDAIVEIVDADLLRLRGRSPLVLVPTIGAADAGVLALLAACVTPPRVGRVLMLGILPPLKPSLPTEFNEKLESSARVMRDSLGSAVHAGARAEALATIAQDPWNEIERVARTHRCDTLLLGMTELSDAALRGQLEALASKLSSNLVLARIPLGWEPRHVRRALVPIRGGPYSALRARLLASLKLRAAAEMEVTYLIVLPTATSGSQRKRREHAYADLMATEASTPATIKSVLSDDIAAAIAEAAEECDLLILGLSRVSSTGRSIGTVMRKVIANTECATLMISEQG